MKPDQEQIVTQPQGPDPEGPEEVAAEGAEPTESTDQEGND